MSAHLALIDTRGATEDAAREVDARLRAIEANAAAAQCDRLPRDDVLVGVEELARRARLHLKALT